MINLHDDTKIRNGELRVLVGLKNFIESHSSWTSYHIRSVKKREKLYLHTLDMMSKSREFRDAVIVGNVDKWIYSEEKGWFDYNEARN